MGELQKIGELLPPPKTRNDLPLPPNSKRLSGGQSISCQICRDQHWVHPRREDGKPDWSKAVPCVCQQTYIASERRQRLLKYCSLPDESEHMSFQSFDTYGNESLFAARAAAEDLAIGEGNIKWLTLISGVDRGKTHLAVAVCRAWLERGFPARYAFLPKLLNELRAGYEDQAVPYQARLDLFCRVDLLVLDDLGVEKPSEWAQEQIQTIVHERGMAGLPLLVTSNRALDDLPIDPLGRIASRLQRESWCKVLVLDAPEHRLV